MKTYVKWAYDSIQVLSLTGSVGTLHNAYANAAGGANVLPTRIFADINVGGVVFTNHASPLSTLLLGVSDSAGNNEHGLYADGLRLHGGPNSIRSNTANPIQMKSGALIGPAYILNVNAPLIASNSLFELRNGGGTTLTAYCNGDLAGHHALTATKVWKIEAAYDGTGMVRWKSDQSGGVSHCPHAPGVGTLGRFDEAWGGVFSRFAAITKRTYPYSPSVDIDLHLASYHESAGLSGDIGIARRYRKRPGETYGTRIVLLEADRISNPGRHADTRCRESSDGYEHDHLQFWSPDAAGFGPDPPARDATRDAVRAVDPTHQPRPDCRGVLARADCPDPGHSGAPESERRGLRRCLSYGPRGRLQVRPDTSFWDSIEHSWRTRY
jgi:hypothetical protein